MPMMIVRGSGFMLLMAMDAGSADDGGDQRRYKGDEQCVDQSIHDGGAIKHLGIPLKGKAAPLGPGFGTVKGQDHHGHDRRI